MQCENIDLFCYVCGHQIRKKNSTTLQKEKNLLTSAFKKAYKLFFDEEDLTGENYTPNTVCRQCYNNLMAWLSGGKHSMKYCKPVNWINLPGDHDETSCYACVNYTCGLNRYAERNKSYKATVTATLPVLAPENFVSPRPPTPDRSTECTGMTRASGVTYEDPFDTDYEPQQGRDGPQLITQMEMDFIVAILGLSQRLAIFLTAFLKQRKLTHGNVNSTAYRKRQAEFQSLYTLNDDNSLAYCNDVKALVVKMGMNYIASEWRLFIDGSVSSLKAVLLHVSNRKPSIPLAMGINMKESYEALKDIMEKIKYYENKWKICCDLKVINILQGIIDKGGFPKFFCFLCNWDSRSPLNQYQCNSWRPRGSVEEQMKQHKLRNAPLIDNTQDILLPPLHIKLGIVKKFIEVAVVNCPNAFDYLKSVFPKRSDDKIKKGIVVNLKRIFVHLIVLFSLC